MDDVVASNHQTEDINFEKKNEQGESNKIKLNDNDARQIAQLDKEFQRMCLTDMFIDFPCLVLFVGFSILCGVTYFALYMEYFKMEFQDQRDLLVWTAPPVRQWMMYDLAKDHL